MTFEEALEQMTQHSVDKPTHGVGCACKDRIIGELRQSLSKQGVQFRWQLDSRDKMAMAKRSNLRYLLRILENSL